VVDAAAALDVGTGPDAGLRFFLEHLQADGTLRWEALAACATERLEDALPVRSFRWTKGAANFPGWWWSSTTGRHVGFESWLERDHVMLMDFDPDITGIASQPFWLHWRDGTGRPRRHAPDFFARRADGGAIVVDVRPDDRIPEQDAEVFRVTAAACEQAGWEFRRAGTIDAVVTANVRWLSRYRHRRCWREAEAMVLLEVFGTGQPLLAGAARAGDPIAVLPVAYHLLWRRELVCDLSVRLSGNTVVRSAAAGSVR
jgi:hypothetical protein